VFSAVMAFGVSSKWCLTVGGAEVLMCTGAFRCSYLFVTAFD